jgi:hypothetical protein
MLNVSPVLTHMNISTTSRAMATSEVGELIRSSAIPTETARMFVNDVLSLPVKFDEPVYAGLVCKHIVKFVIDNECVVDIDSVDEILENAQVYATAYCNDPANSYMWAELDEKFESNAGHVQVATGIDTKVAVLSSGKIKKGGKQLLCAEMYKKFVIDAEVPLTSREFKDLLIKELDMTPAGASTYEYNCKAKHKKELAAVTTS